MITLSDTSNSRLKFLFLFLLAAIPFWLLDTQAVWLGDDFGYFFADSSLHSGDGARITSIGQIPAAQAAHWMSCNGRYIIHSIVMWFVAIGGLQSFAVCNAVMFGLLFVCFYRLVLPGRETSLTKGIILLLLLWMCIPKPGITMLSLAAYAVNYLWTAAAILLFLLLWRDLGTACSAIRKYLTIFFALFAALLQESYSIPVSAGLLVYWWIHRRDITESQVAAILCFWLGSIMVFFAPGNLSHAEQGGGFAVQALIDKNRALASDILFSSINLLALILVGLIITIPNRCGEFFRRNSLLLTAVLASLLLATVSYTAVRQLFAPSIFSAILLGRLLFSFGSPNFSGFSRKMLAVGLYIIYGGLMWGAYIIRQYPEFAMKDIISQAKAGETMIIVPENPHPESELFNTIFDRYNDDPTIDRELKLSFDKYSKQGLSRIYHPSHSNSAIHTILPASPTKIVEAALKADTTYSDFKISTTPLSEYYNVAKFPTDSNGKMKYRFAGSPEGNLRYEKIRVDTTMYFVFPAEIRTIKLAQRQPQVPGF